MNGSRDASAASGSSLRTRNRRVAMVPRKTAGGSKRSGDRGGLNARDWVGRNGPAA
jgi:hypothetical protein